MQIIIEIGTTEQKELIERELKLLSGIARKLNMESKIKQIIIPENFDKKVNEIQGTKHYSSQRQELKAVAKNVIKEQDVYLVFSNSLFTFGNDHFTRMHMYLHELIHAYNALRFCLIDKDSLARYEYIENLKVLFDEYYVNRKSFEIIDKIFSKTSLLYKKYIYYHCKGFIKTAAGKEGYDFIRGETAEFRLHGNVELFLKKIQPTFDEVSKAIVYCYTYFDYCPRLKKYEPELYESKFSNPKTSALIDFFREQYQNNDFDLLKGEKYIARFLENFGISFEDTPTGLYCHVLNI